MARSRGRLVVWIVLLVVIAVLAYWGRDRLWPEPSTVAAPAASGPSHVSLAPPAPQPASAPVRPPVPPAPRQVSAEHRAQAASLMARGLSELGQDKLLAARATLSDALNTGALSEADAAGLRAKLTDLADRTLFSPEAVEGDPCTDYFRFRSGDVLVRVERELKLRVPYQLILRVNRIDDPRQIQAGQRLKMIRGPFHAVVSKSRFTMDLYLQEPETNRMIFVRRVPVGIGKDGSTPLGRWRVCGKMERAPWTPPSSSDLARSKVLWGESDYPLGKKGYWIGLEGIEDNVYTKEDGYGIHDTKDQSSIGREASMGCIRLADGDIDLVYALLYETISTVTVLE